MDAHLHQLAEAGLAKILASGHFAQSPRQRELLAYLARHCFAANADPERLKGYVIGVEVFGRGKDFDPTVDAIVRVEAGRLRTRLRDYYAGEGRNDLMRLDIPKGAYALSYRRREDVLPREAEKAATTLPVLAVLPFIDSMGIPGEEYFAEGLADGLLHELSRLSGIRTISRQSSFAYRNIAKNTREIGRELRATFLVTGSVQRAGGSIRVIVQLIDVVADTTIWSERFDSRLEGMFSLQDDLTQGIVRALQIRLAPAEARLFGHEDTNNVEAHDAFLRGLACYWRMAPPFLGQAHDHFTRAITLDPNYAAAHALLAQSKLHMWITAISAPLSLRDDALRHAETACALNEALPFAHSILGWVHLWFKHPDEAIRHCRRAVAMDPNNTEVLLRLSMALSLTGRSVDGESLYLAEKALDLNPLSSPMYQFAVACAYMVLEDYDNAIVALKRGCELESNFLPNQVQLSLLYALLGMEKELKIQRNLVLHMVGGNPLHVLRRPWVDPVLDAFYLELATQAGYD